MFPVGLDLCLQIVQQMKKAGNDHLLTLVQYPEAGHLLEPPYTPHFRATRFNKSGEWSRVCHVAFRAFPHRRLFAFQRLLCGGERPNLIRMLRKTPGGGSWPFSSSSSTPTRPPEQRFDGPRGAAFQDRNLVPPGSSYHSWLCQCLGSILLLLNYSSSKMIFYLNDSIVLSSVLKVQFQVLLCSIRTTADKHRITF